MRARRYPLRVPACSTSSRRVPRLGARGVRAAQANSQGPPSPCWRSAGSTRRSCPWGRGSHTLRYLKTGDSVGQSPTALGTATKLISLITELISQRLVRTLPISRNQRRGKHVHTTQCVHWCLVGVPILSQVTAVFTLASFAPAQSIDQGWRLSGAANPNQILSKDRARSCFLKF